MNGHLTTRESLHAVAELLLAGPQYATTGTIKLRVTPGGFGTTTAPEARVAGTSLITAEQIVALTDRTIAEVAQAMGVAPRSLSDVYPDHVNLTPAAVLQVTADEAADIAEAFRRGHEALTALAPTEVPVLWPEHFDLGISVDEINYGVSAGDTYIGVPYAYVGPWDVGSLDTSAHSGKAPFWNAPFGAALPVSEVADLVSFFREGQILAGGRT